MRLVRWLLLVFFGIALVLIYQLPKSVVANESQLGTGAVDTPQPHGAVPPAQAEAIRKVRAQYNAHSSKEKNAIFADSLASLYKAAGKFDSAAWFAEEAATFFASYASFLKAADNYYEAYFFALEPTRQKALAEKAQQYYGRVLETDPGNLDIRTKVAMTRLATSPPMQAIGELKGILEENPDHEGALYNLGVLSLQTNQYAAAIERFERLVEVNSQNVQAHLLLGVAYANEGQKGKARQQFEKVKQLDPDPAVQATADSYLKDLLK